MRKLILLNFKRKRIINLRVFKIFFINIFFSNLEIKVSNNEDNAAMPNKKTSCFSC